jgi:hypothetical protein
MDAFSTYISYGIAGIVFCGASLFACSGTQTISLVRITFTVCRIIVLDKLQKFFPSPLPIKIKQNLKPRRMATLQPSTLHNKNENQMAMPLQRQSPTQTPPLPMSPPESPPLNCDFKRLPLDGSGNSENELIELGQY